MKKKNRACRLMAGLLTGTVLSAMLLISCGSSKEADSRMAVSEPRDYSGYGAMTEGAVEDTMVMETAAEKNASAGTAENDGTVDTREIDAARKLIRNASLSFETERFDEFTAKLQQETKALGGYIESSDISGNTEYSYGRNAYFTFRIPQQQLDAFLSFAEGEAKLTRKYETTQDVTLSYHDIESRKKALETERDRLLELMAQAESMDAIIALEQRLSEIRYQLESFESNLRLYDNQVEYSTVSVDVTEKKLVSVGVKAGFVERISTGFRENLGNLGEGIVDLAVFLIVYLPQLLILLLIVLGAVVLGRRLLRRSNSKVLKKMEQPPLPPQNMPGEDGKQ